MKNPKILIISHSNFVHVIDLDQILYCKSDNSYSSIHLLDGRSFILVKSLAKVAKEDLDNKNFIRVSQSYLVNRNFIQLVDKKHRTIEMSGRIMLPFTINIRDLLALLSESSEIVTAIQLQANQ